MADLEARVEIRTEPLDALDSDILFDIVLSNSCLEHVLDLPASVAHLKSLCKKDARQIHLIDFGNHRSTQSPFEGIYQWPREKTPTRGWASLNLLKPSEALAVFKDAGFEAQLIPYYRGQEPHRETIHPWWRERYDDDDLFTKAGLLAVTDSLIGK